MRDRNLLPFYILSTISAVLMLAYLFMSFLPIIKINDLELNVYRCAIEYRGYKTNPIIMIGLIFTLFAMVLVLFVPILSLFKKIKLNFLLFLSTMSLPFIAFGAIICVASFPIYRAANSYNPTINAKFVVLVFQGLFLFATLFINISMLFYLAIKLFKYSSFKRTKKDIKK